MSDNKESNEKNRIQLNGIFAGGYGIVPKDLMRMKINKNLKLILAYMLTYTGSGNDTCFPSIRTIAGDLSMSTTTVTRYIKEACDRKLIAKSKLNDNPMNHANKYKMLLLTHDVSSLENIDVSPSVTPDVSVSDTPMCHPVSQNINSINNTNDNNTKKNLSLQDYSFKAGSLCKNIEDSFQSIEKWEKESYSRERKEVKRIADYCYEISPTNPGEFAAKLLHCLLRIKKENKHFLKDTPFRPSGLTYKIYLRLKDMIIKSPLPDIVTPEDKEAARALAWYFGDNHG